MRPTGICFLIALIIIYVLIKKHYVVAPDGSFEELIADAKSIEADHGRLSRFNKVVVFRNGKKGNMSQSGKAAAYTETGNFTLSKYRMNERKNLTVQLAVVICGTRLQEGLMMLKSAAIFTLTKLHFHVFAEDHLHIPIRQRLNEISVISQNTITYDVLPIKFPKDNADIWKKLFKPCSCQRLFLPYLLKKTDSLIYLDTDILFMRPPEDLWNFFNKFNATQLVAVSPEGEDIRTSWYNKFAQHPYYGKLGINSDVILMNLTRMRKANWNDKVTKVYQKYRSSIVLGDQDILNAIFHFHPEMVYVLTCAWNYRPDHCRYGRNDCKHAYKNGVSLLHGDRQTFHKNDFPSFRIVYEVIQNYDFKTGVTRGIYNPLKRILPMVQKSYCSRIWESMIMILKRYLREHKL